MPAAALIAVEPAPDDGSSHAPVRRRATPRYPPATEASFLASWAGRGRGALFDWRPCEARSVLLLLWPLSVAIISRRRKLRSVRCELLLLVERTRDGGGHLPFPVPGAPLGASFPRVRLPALLLFALAPLALTFAFRKVGNRPLAV